MFSKLCLNLLFISLSISQLVAGESSLPIPLVNETNSISNSRLEGEKILGFHSDSHLSSENSVLVNGLSLLSSVPSSNATGVNNTANLSLTFNVNLNPSTITTGSIPVIGQQSGIIPGVWTVSQNVATFDPSTNLVPGEVIHVEISPLVLGAGGESFASIFGFSFTVASQGPFQGANWVASTTPQVSNWYDLVYGEGRLVAVANTGLTMYSDNHGLTWTSSNALDANILRAITIGNGRFVAVASTGSNQIRYSDNGLNWTAVSAPEANNWYDVTYGKNRFVAVATTGTNRVMYSNDGVSWSLASAPEANEWRSVTYGNGRFVAVASSGSNRVMYSMDGITWTAASTVPGNTWYEVTYGNGLFVAVALDGTNKVMYSTDGITWTVTVAAEEANRWWSVSYGNGRFVAVSETGTNRVMYSSNGINWISAAATAANQWLSVTYTGKRFVALSNNGSNPIMVSSLPPSLVNLNGDQVGWPGRGDAVRLDQNSNATVADSELESRNGGNGDWSGASLSVQRLGTANSEDLFSFTIAQGTTFSVVGSSLMVGGQSFASFTNASGVLTVTFSSQGTTATTALVNEVLRSITYRNFNPSGDVTLRHTLNDGSGLAATADVVVTSDFIYVTNSTNTATIDVTNGVSFSEAIAIAAADVTGNQQIVFASNLANQSLTVGTNAISESLVFDMDLAPGITLTGGTLTSAAGTTLTFSNGTGDNATITAVLAGDGAIKKSGLGVVNLRASNTFRGITTIAGGTISIGLDDNLGTPPATPTPGHLVLENGGILKFVNVTTAFIGVNSNRGVLLNGTGGEFDVSSSTEPSVSSIIAGTGSLTKSGPSQIRVDGLNTYSGGTIVNGGTLFGGAGSGTKTSFGVGTITINATGTLWGDRNNLSNPVILNGGKLLGSNGFGEIWNGPITIQSNSIIELGYYMIINGPISGPGKLTMAGSSNNSSIVITNTASHTGGTELTRGNFIIGNNGTTGEILSNITTTVNSQVWFGHSNTFTYPGIISGPGTVKKWRSGTAMLTGANTYTGATIIENGTLMVNGSITSAVSISPTSGVTGTLGGTGAITGNVSFQTRGILAPGSTIGALTINGDLSMVAGSTLAVDLNGSTVGTENDQIVVNGTVDVTGATLTVNHNNTGGGTLYTIIQNDQSDVVTGAFNGIAEGALFTMAGNGALLSASYTTNGSGNDIVLVNRFSPVIGSGQTANVKEAVAFPPTIQVSNADGTPAANTTVSFVTPTGKVNTPYLANSASWYSTDGSLVSNVDWKAHVFTTGNDPVSIDQISLVLNSSDPINFPYPLSVTAEAALYQVSNGVPTQEIQSSGSQTVQLNASGTWKNFDFTTPVSLSPQTQYAIVVKSGNATGFKWAIVRTLPTVAGGVGSTSLSLSSTDGGGQWTTAIQNNAYALRSVAATATSVTITTNANGIAALGKWVLGDRQGSQSLTVTSASLPNNPLTFSATAVAVVPSAPTNLVATPGLGTVSIAFTPGYDGGANLSNYQYSLNNGSTWTSFSPAITSSPVSITGLTNGVTYTIQLRGVNSIGQGVASASVSATPVKAISDPSITVDPLTSQTFTGSSISPTLVVKDGNTPMVLGTDYSVAYSANTNVGTATVTLSGLGSYSGTRSVTFAIVAKDASTLTIDAIANQTYTRATLTPAVLVKDGSTTLTATTDYTVAYTNNTNVGTATVTITGAGNYSGTKTQTFAIVAKAASTLIIDAIANQTYTGSALTPAVVVKDGSTTLTATTDYTVAYTNNTNAGTATVTITGAGNYTGTKTQNFTIAAKSASTLTIDAIANQTYTGSALTPVVIVKDGSTTLTATTDYTVAYMANTNVGTATVTITGAGNYTGTKTQTFTIAAKAASTLTIDAIANQTYTGSALTPGVIVKDGNTTLTTTTDYMVAYTNNTNVGTATVTITGAGNYSGTKTQTFTIAAKAANTLTIDAIANQTYTGLALTPVVVVKDGNTTLNLGTDYTAAYSANTTVGTATVTITGVGNYTGTKTATFAILAKPATALSVDPIANQTYSGSPINPGLVVKDGATTLVRGVDFTVSFSGSTNVGTVIVTITGIGNYSGTIQQTFTIAAKPATSLTIGAIANQVYSGSTLTPNVVVKDGNVTLELGTDYSIAYSGNTNAGTATVTVTGLGNYSASKTQTFNIAPKALTLRAENKSKIYGDANPDLSFSYSGLAAGDTRIDELPNISTSATANSTVGNYRIVLSGGADPNYDLSFVEGVLEVIPANLTLTAYSVTKIYGQEDPFFGYTLDGLKGLDTEAVITGSLVRVAGEDPGIYSIGLGNVSPGANYDLSYVGGTIEILIARALSVVELETVKTNWSKEATLPSTVSVGTTDGQFFNVGVNWDTSTLNLLARGTYTVYGTPVLPVGIENPDEIKAQVQVVVLPKAIPLDVTISNNTFEGSSTTYFIPVGAFLVNDPADNIHVVSLFGDGYDNKYFEIKNNILLWSSKESASGKTNFTIVVRVTDRDGNTIEKFFEIKRTRQEFSSLKIPTAFTPNGDGINDTWKIADLRFYSNVRIQIFNQGGDMMFYTEIPDQGWDGTTAGKNLPVGSYFWAIEIGETGEIRRGIVNLIRK